MRYRDEFYGGLAVGVVGGFMFATALQIITVWLLP